MAIRITEQNGNAVHGVISVVCDKLTDLPDLPKYDCEPGSTAFVIENSSVYMLNTAKEWKEI